MPQREVGDAEVTLALTGLTDGARHRLAWKTLASTVHLYECADCHAEPIVSLDGDHNPVLACRAHGADAVKERKP